MSSTYGENLKLSIFGQSHGVAIGMTLDGIPAGLPVDTDALQIFLNRRAPGQNDWSTPRKEADRPEFLSGILDGFTCGAPIAAAIYNKNTRSGDYANLKDCPRPGHADFTAVHTVSGNGFPEFDILEGGKTAAHIKLAVPGTHNVYNAVAAYAAARLIGISPEKAANGLNAFHGVKRRFELCEGIDSQAAFYADYAHHPDELKATLAAARSVTRGKVIAVFQPHTYSRLKSFFDDFTEALKTADTVIITDVYAARETNDCGVSGKLLADSINGAMYIPSFDTVADTLLKTASAGDTVMILGAGDIIRLVDILRRK